MSIGANKRLPKSIHDILQFLLQFGHLENLKDHPQLQEKYQTMYVQYQKIFHSKHAKTLPYVRDLKKRFDTLRSQFSNEILQLSVHHILERIFPDGSYDEIVICHHRERSQYNIFECRKVQRPFFSRKKTIKAYFGRIVIDKSNIAEHIYQGSLKDSGLISNMILDGFGEYTLSKNNGDSCHMRPGPLSKSPFNSNAFR